MTTTRAKAAIADLYHVRDDANAEIVNGEVVLIGPTGSRPGRASFNIASSLRRNERPNNPGRAFADNVGFVVDLPNRNSFSPDAAWYIGNIDSVKFLEGAPVFAAEVRSENDYGPDAEKRIREKRADYFAAGTSVVWDVDLLSEGVLNVYRASEPNNPSIYRRGEIAETEPSVPGWTMAVDQLFE
jgi:Uma2 family endonuclease